MNVLQVSSTATYRFVVCPCCRKKQLFEYNMDDKIWFPISPFCCDAMRHSDDPEWNAALDRNIVEALHAR